MVRSSLSRFQYFPILALALSMVVGGYYYDKTLDNWVTDIVSNYMSNLLDDVSHQIQEKELDLYDMSQPEIDDFLDNLSQSSFEQRFTIIHSSGAVLGDSQLTNREISQLEDHSSRPEIIAALSGETGLSKRFSQSLNQELLYVAKKLELPEDDHGHDSTYVLRLAMPMTSLYAMSADLKLIEHALMAFSLAILILLTWLSNRKIYKLVKEERDQQEYRIQKKYSGDRATPPTRKYARRL